MNRTILSVAAVALAAAINAFSVTAASGKRIAALDDAHWNSSVWISAAKETLNKNRIEGKNERAADGASWFLTELVLAVPVSPAWGSHKIITPGGNDGMIGKKVAFRGVLELTFADGSTQVLGTDTARWKAGVAGPVKHASIFDGEEYDARIAPGYSTPELLSTPEVNTEFNGGIFPTNGAEIYMRDDLALVPQRAYLWKGVTGAAADAYGKVIITKEFAKGQEITVSPSETLVIDFGQNCAAVPSFLFKAAAGTKLTCLPAELLNDGNGAHSRGMDGPEGSVHRCNLRIPDIGMQLFYTFGSNKGYVAYRPQCTFFGYRFVSITATAEVKIKKITSVPVTSITKDMEIGTITTGNVLVIRLSSNTVWGMRSNYLSVPTDCPQRNERLGWTADTQVFTETGTFFANTNNFFHKWLRDMRDTQNAVGGYPGVAPAIFDGEEYDARIAPGYSTPDLLFHLCSMAQEKTI